MTNHQERTIRATYTDDTITVYQAYNKHIAQSAAKAQTFVSPPFKMGRMTWVKPSFLWMMYRSGWATKESQEAVLSIQIKREGFEWALENSCLSHFDEVVHTNQEEWKSELQQSPVRIQWDPEKDLHLNALPYRSIQIGLTADAVEKYVSEWIVGIEDITEKCYTIKECLAKQEIEKAKSMLPIERTYPLPEDIGRVIRLSNSY